MKVKKTARTTLATPAQLSHYTNNLKSGVGFAQPWKSQANKVK